MSADETVSQKNQNFAVQKDCELINVSLTGGVANDNALISVLCNRSLKQRMAIKRKYQETYSRDLEKDIETYVSGHFQKLLVRLLKIPVELAAYELHGALHGLATDEDCLMEVICTNSQQVVKSIKAKYQEMYGVQLEKEIASDTSGYFRKLLLALLNCDRPPDEEAVDKVAAAKDARILYESGEKKLGTDEQRFIDILCGRSYNQLCAIFEIYAKEYKKDISEVIRSEFSGDLERALLALVGGVRNCPAHFATRLNFTMKGLVTNDDMLLRIIVSRFDFDIGAIKSAYAYMYNKSLAEAVDEHTSGDFKRALLALIGN